MFKKVCKIVKIGNSIRKRGGVKIKVLFLLIIFCEGWIISILLGYMNLKDVYCIF